MSKKKKFVNTIGVKNFIKWIIEYSLWENYIGFLWRIKKVEWTN
jgi:hypothetical protein